MAFIHQQSCEGVKSELDIFAVPPTQTSIDEGQWMEHQPMTSLDSGGPIEFVVPGTGDAYIDLANTYLFVRAKIIRGVGTNLCDDTPAAPVNNWLHWLFSQVDVYLNDSLVTPSSNTYPFRAYVETLLNTVPRPRKHNSPASCGTRIRPDTSTRRKRTVVRLVWPSSGGGT